MKIMHMFGHTWGGAFVVTQLVQLQRQGHDVVVVCPGPGPFADNCRKNGIRVIFSPFNGSSIKDVFRIVGAATRLVRTIRNIRPDVLHYHLIKATLVGRLAGSLARVPKRYSQMGGPLTLETKRFRWLDLATAPLDTGVICPSLAVKSIYDRYATTRSKTSLLYYGFEHRQFADAQQGAERAGARSELGIGQDNPVVGMVAYMYGSGLPQFRDISLKGHETLIDAARYIVARFPNVRFLVVGEDPDGSRINFDRFRALVVRQELEEYFIFTGFRQDIPRLIAVMDVAVVPSLSENCGGAVEPLAGGIPVVASDTGGLPELVLPGLTGALFRPGVARELAERVNEILSLSVTDRTKLGLNGQKLVSYLFDPKRCAQAQIAIYNQMSRGQLEEYDLRLKALTAR